MASRKGQKLQNLMKRAEIVAELSYCNRKKVGALLVKDGRVIGEGRNGTLATATDKCCEDSEGNTKPEVLHAEQNLLMYACKNGTSTKDCEVFVTLSPCKTCAILMVQAGIKKVYYRTTYSDTTGLELLKENGVDVYRL